MYPNRSMTHGHNRLGWLLELRLRAQIEIHVHIHGVGGGNLGSRSL